MSLTQFMLWIPTVAFAGPQQEFVSSVENFPTLILGFMLVGGLFGGLLVVSSRRRREAAPVEAPAPPVAEAPPLPIPSLRPQTLEPIAREDGSGGFAPADDFEEPTCFAELPTKRNDG